MMILIYLLAPLSFLVGVVFLLDFLGGEKFTRNRLIEVTVGLFFVGLAIFLFSGWFFQ